jgi:D-alanyl-D-alanine carboxypeptidase
MRGGQAPGLRRAAGIFAFALAALALTVTQADARWRRHVHKTSASESDSDSGWREGYASIVVDAKTGKVLQESNADKLRHPASLTKIMTLYMLFEQIEAGRIKLNTRITVSEHAADAAPTKLGLDAGEKIEVEDAIKAVVTRSANDMAIAIGETIAGSEEAFAARMTKKARALGMYNTVFTNASGLPDKRQVTTARDLSILGRAIQDRFPNLYRYFSIRAFTWRGAQIANHNHLLGTDGVDGIKTGYTRASGFNLVTSVKRNNRFIVAVVLGGRSSSARDARMRELIAEYMPRAYAGARTAPMIAEAADPDAAKAAPRFAARIAHPPLPRPAPVEGSREPIRPLPVRTVQLNKNSELPLPSVPNSGTLGTLTISPFGDVSAGPAQAMQVTAYSDTRTLAAPPAFAPADRPKPAEAAAPAQASASEAPAPAETRPAAVKVAAATLSSLQLTSPAEAAPAPVQPPARAEEPAQQKPAINAALARPIPAGWQIQIGAYTGEPEAQTRLQAARARLGGALARATSFTEKTIKGSVEYVRARFAGFSSEAEAKKACEALRRNDFACITVKD